MKFIAISRILFWGLVTDILLLKIAPSLEWLKSPFKSVNCWEHRIKVEKVENQIGWNLCFCVIREWWVVKMMRTLLNFEFPALFGMYNFVPHFHQKCQNVDRLVNTYVGNTFLSDSNITTTTKHKTNTKLKY